MRKARDAGGKRSKWFDFGLRTRSEERKRLAEVVMKEAGGMILWLDGNEAFRTGCVVCRCQVYCNPEPSFSAPSQSCVGRDLTCSRQYISASCRYNRRAQNRCSSNWSGPLLAV